jgi:hypothetical protein
MALVGQLPGAPKPEPVVVDDEQRIAEPVPV